MIGGDALMARLGLDTSGFKAGLKEAHSAFNSFAGKLGIGFTVAGFEQGIEKILAFGKRIDSLSMRYNVNAEALQRLGNAAEQNGSSLEGVAKGFNKLDVAISRALGGSVSILKSFDALGISIDDLRRLSPEEIMAKIGKSSMNAADLVKVLGKSGLELRPILAGLADGTIEYGKAVSSVDIRKLAEADAIWKKLGEEMKVAGANYVALYLTQGQSAVASAGRAYTDALKGNFTKFIKDLGATTKAELKMLATLYGASPESLKSDSGKASEIDKRRKFDPTGDGTVPKSKAELDAEKKERERDQLSLKDLADKGPHSAFRQGDSYTQSNGTAQMIYASQQARLVEQLEAQARRVRLSGVSPTGESSAQLLGRADAIRQTLPIKETEKEVGIYRQAFKDALNDTNQVLNDIRDELE